jgi:hypothetical protein
LLEPIKATTRLGQVASWVRTGVEVGGYVTGVPTPWSVAGLAVVYARRTHSILEAGLNLGVHQGPLSRSSWHGPVSDFFQRLGFNVCFAPGTPLRVPGGSRNIEDIRPGDRVLARDEHNGEGPVEAKVVEEVFVREGLLWRLDVNGRSIRTTAEHPFFVAGAGWVKCQELKVGDRLWTEDGSWVTVEAVEDTGIWATVYNLRVADHHTYFVGKEEWGFSVWAHNAYDPQSAALEKSLASRLGTKGQAVIDKLWVSSNGNVQRFRAGLSHLESVLEANVIAAANRTRPRSAEWMGNKLAEALLNDHLYQGRYNINRLLSDMATVKEVGGFHQATLRLRQAQPQVKGQVFEFRAAAYYVRQGRNVEAMGRSFIKSDIDILMDGVGYQLKTGPTSLKSRPSMESWLDAAGNSGVAPKGLGYIFTADVKRGMSKPMSELLVERSISPITLPLGFTK